MEKPLILLTNDDGIQSPGLWAAAEALSAVGYVEVAAPREQSTGMGRSLPGQSDGRIDRQTVVVHGQPWTVYAVGGSPAQVVIHALLEILPQVPRLVVSGINYGENAGSGVTISGTVGAALEASANGVPGLAVSLQTEPHNHNTHSREVDFSAAAHFTAYFARLMLGLRLPEDVDVLKVEVPAEATPATPWRLTRLAKMSIYTSLAPERAAGESPGRLGYRYAPNLTAAPPGTDVHTLYALREVAVTPLSLDLTARTDLAGLESALRHGSAAGS